MQALIIDDAKAMRLILRQILTSLDYEVSDVNNGRDGLEKLRQLTGVDLVMVDFYMPDMDGVEFVRAVRSNSAYDSVRLLMVTSEDDPARIDMAMEAGANGYLQKPFGRHDLLDKIRGLGIALSRI